MLKLLKTWQIGNPMEMRELCDSETSTRTYLAGVGIHGTQRSAAVAWGHTNDGFWGCLCCCMFPSLLEAVQLDWPLKKTWECIATWNPLARYFLESNLKIIKQEKRQVFRSIYSLRLDFCKATRVRGYFIVMWRAGAYTKNSPKDWGYSMKRAGCVFSFNHEIV